MKLRRQKINPVPGRLMIPIALLVLALIVMAPRTTQAASAENSGTSHSAPVEPEWPSIPIPEDPAAIASWKTLTGKDLEALKGVIATDYIYAVYPGGPDWDALVTRLYDRARQDISVVKNIGGYRAVMERFIGGFHDAHFSAYFRALPDHAQWPGFSLEYRGGRYIVSASVIPDVHSGDELVSCDGRNMNSWMDSLTDFYGGARGRETTRAAIASQLMVDLDNPLFSRPRKCRIGGEDVALHWTETGLGPGHALPLPPERTTSSVGTLDDGSIVISEFGTHGAWVRIGTMIPLQEDQVRAFENLIAAAPTLRDKEVLVIDVRGNAGGIYNWFMAFLRALYGQEYADYYARARLEIASTDLVPAVPAGSNNPGISNFEQSKVPRDPPMEVKTGEPRVRALPTGARLVSARAPIDFTQFPRRPPKSLLGARVYLLTDYGCGSACLAFVDEMMRIPRVTLIGAETHLDRRSGGWPMGIELPSGLAVVRMGRMVRDGRHRGENEAWVPAEPYRFRGDIADTEAVKRWIENEILPRDAAARGPWVQRATLSGPE